MTDTNDSATVARRKGPWFWQVDKHDQPIALMQSGTGDYIATPQADISDYGLRVDCYIDIADDHAAMITAIPEMFALAEKVASLNPEAGEIGEGMLRTIINMARESVAKATGQ